MYRMINSFFNERIENVKQQGPSYSPENKRIKLGSISIRSISLGFIAFMLGRLSLVGGITPFGAAFFAATYKKGVSPYTIAGGIILGILSWSWSSVLVIKFIAVATLFSLLTIFAKWCRLNGELINVIKVFASVFLVSVFPLFFNFYLYDFILYLFESAVSVLLYVLMKKGAHVLLLEEVKKIFSFEEVISLGVIGALTIAGIRDFNIFGAEIRTIVCILIVFIFSRSKGAGSGAATGVTMGLISSLAGTANFNVIGSYAFSGFLSGIFRKLGNMGVILGFVTGNALLTYLLNGSTDILLHLRDIILASILLYLIPMKYANQVTRIFEDRTISLEDKNEPTAINPTVNKLHAFSKAVEELATTFNSVPSPEHTPGEVEVSNFFDTIADRVCTSCSLCLYCWDRKFHNTYQAMFSLLEVLENKGKITSEDIPVCFSEDSCARPEELMNTINSLYEVYRVNLLWKKKVQESRALVSQQLEGVSRMISNLAREVDSETSTKKNLELKILKLLETKGYSVSEINIVTDESDSTEILLLLSSCAGMNKCRNELSQLISEVLGKKVIPKGFVCTPDYTGGRCKITFSTGQVYNVTVGVSKTKKIDSPVSGDNYTFMELKDKKYVLGLSDGMGSGKTADRNSKIAVDLLEKFMDSGFDKDIAVKLINSVLLLKTVDESYATMDISVIDLYSGNVEFVKIGSPPSYIKKKNKVEIIKGASLPAGILENLDLDLFHGRASAGDFIIMVTDGVADSNLGDIDSTDWLADFIEQVDTFNPQELADTIMHKACSNYGPRIGDDVTVLVAKVWESF